MFDRLLITGFTVVLVLTPDPLIHVIALYIYCTHCGSNVYVQHPGPDDQAMASHLLYKSIHHETAVE